MVANETDYVSKFQIGATYEGRQMYALKIAKPSGKEKPVIYVDALIHCREWISTASTMWMFAQVSFLEYHLESNSNREFPLRSGWYVIFDYFF